MTLGIWFFDKSELQSCFTTIFESLRHKSLLSLLYQCDYEEEVKAFLASIFNVE